MHQIKFWQLHAQVIKERLVSNGFPRTFLLLDKALITHHLPSPGTSFLLGTSQSLFECSISKASRTDCVRHLNTTKLESLHYDDFEDGIRSQFPLKPQKLISFQVTGCTAAASVVNYVNFDGTDYHQMWKKYFAVNIIQDVDSQYLNEKESTEHQPCSKTSVQSCNNP